MDPLSTSLGLVALAAILAVIWLLLERARWMSRVQALAAHDESAQQEIVRLTKLEHEHRTQLQAELERVGAMRVELAQLREQQSASEKLYHEKLAALELLRKQTQTQGEAMLQRSEEIFRSLASKALQESSQQFLTLAQQRLTAQTQAGQSSLEQLVKPIAETLRKADEKLATIEKERTSAYASLEQQLRATGEASRELRDQTGRLVQALKKPEVRGRWGEIQLEKVVELAGMKSYCDYTPQDSTRDGDGRLLRPDMTVTLPNGRCVAVDAKTNINAYLEAIEAGSPEQSEAYLERFAQHVSDQVAALSRKGYWAQYDGSPEFVVMFIPGDQFVDAAIQRRPDLIEKAAQLRVILASPSTLIGLLRAVAVGWRERKIEEQARELFRLGRELHERAAVVAEHMAKLGESLDQSVRRYNQAAASFQSRLTPTLRKFEEADARSSKELVDLDGVLVQAKPALPVRVAVPEQTAAQLPGF